MSVTPRDGQESVPISTVEPIRRFNGLATTSSSEIRHQLPRLFAVVTSNKITSRTIINAKRTRGGKGKGWGRVQTLNERDSSRRTRIGTPSPPWSQSAGQRSDMVTAEKEGGEQLDSVTNRELLRLHLKDSFTEALEHQLLLTVPKIPSPPSLSKLRMLRSSTFSLFAPYALLQLYGSILSLSL
ncbi:hypothetical protein PoB_005184000 [Plakobranchus ocellatus]|uniref:Uncharacterized protein n=1 Tax=Plakobranchus ocellatus TaxID=259542 RepID=A0AAV4C1Q9_9GAST|nr:hypothetical protein PoB_005184000 [Plakobranchus ocellatus]